MEGSGATANEIDVTLADGRTVRQTVVADRERVEIGGAISFSRRELLLAVGLTQADIDDVHGRPSP
jgi:hypothetical protein